MDKTKNKKFLIILAIGTVLIFVSACATQTTNKATETQQPSGQPSMQNTQDTQTTTETGATTYTIQELAKHSTRDDCWLLIHGKVYDVTSFVSNHPGGEAILEGCGKDATQLYETRPMGSGTPHSQRARDSLENFYIGEIQ